MESTAEDTAGSGGAWRALWWTLASLLAYMLSGGPVWWAVNHAILPRHTLAVYHPLLEVPGLNDLIKLYWNLWAPVTSFS